MGENVCVSEREIGKEIERDRGYGVASYDRLLKIIGLFCKRDLLKRRYSVKETYNLIDPTDHSHPI